MTSAGTETPRPPGREPRPDVQGGLILGGMALFVGSGVLWAWGYGFNPVLAEEMHTAFLCGLAPAALLWAVLAIRLRRSLPEGALAVTGRVRGYFVVTGGLVLSFALLGMGSTGLLLGLNGTFAGEDDVHETTVRAKDSVTRTHNGSTSGSSTSTVYYVDVDDWVDGAGERRIGSDRDYFTSETWSALAVGDRLRIRTRPGLLGWTTVVSTAPAAAPDPSGSR